MMIPAGYEEDPGNPVACCNGCGCIVHPSLDLCDDCLVETTPVTPLPSGLGWAWALITTIMGFSVSIMAIRIWQLWGEK